MSISIHPVWELVCADCAHRALHLTEEAAHTAKANHLRICQQSDSPLAHYLRERGVPDQMGLFDDSHPSIG